MDSTGYHNRPHAKFEKWQINGRGFRGPELSITKPAGMIRIGIAGASEIFGLYESPGKDVTSQLRTLLEASAPGRFEVVNLASPGMSLPRIRDLFEKRVRRLDLDAILLYPSPALYLDIKPPARELPPTETDTDPFGSPKCLLRLPDKTWRMLREKLPAELQVRLKWLLIERVRRTHPASWVWSSLPMERVGLFTQDVADLVRIFQQAGTQAVLATYADRFGGTWSDEDRRMMVGWIRFYPRATAEDLVDMDHEANAAVRRLAGDLGVPLVDVQAAVGKDPGHYADFVHFTDAGAHRAAQAIAHEVLNLYQGRISEKVPMNATRRTTGSQEAG